MNRIPPIPRVAEIPRPAPRTHVPNVLGDPLADAHRDRQILQSQIATLDAALTEANGTINALRADIDARVRELDRAVDAIRDRDVLINRLRSYAISVRTRLASFAEQAAALHAEAMTESVEAIMGEEASGGAGEPADEPEAEPAPEAAPPRETHHEPRLAVYDRGRLPINRFG